MKAAANLVGWTLLTAILSCLANWPSLSLAQEAESTNEIRIVAIQNTVEVRQRGAATWVLTQTNQVLYPSDHLRTGPNSSVAVIWPGQSVVRFGPLTEIEINPPESRDWQPGLHLIRGILSFFHRDKPGRIRVITSGGLAGIRGTEFAMEVEETNGVERTTLLVIDGMVQFENKYAALVLTNGEQAIAEPGKAPTRTAVIAGKNLLQWFLYYPAVLDVNELPLSAGEEASLGESLAAYRAGDLLAALAKYPVDRTPASDAERVYHAALVLSVGQMGQARADLSTISPTAAGDRLPRLANALRTLIATVTGEPGTPAPDPRLATETLAGSYYEQSRAIPGASLEAALELASRSAATSPDFGFAWERVAELQFSFGRTKDAIDALNKSLALAPRNAQALTLKGFLLAAQSKPSEAIEWFNRAIAVDSGLGNAWLGRGLCRIGRGDLAGGREDLLIAAAMEPQRAVLRSYLGKAWSDSGDDARATKELELAETLDPNDPTPWLYSALVNQQENRINEAIRDLENSQALNDNRSVYRSQLLLDQDRAVRSANLAGIYQDAGMTDWSVLEASRAVTYDYANYSAHLFLANSYQALRDPNLFNTRYETPAVTEYLVANLLAPADAGPLSPAISQQEYSRLFERDRLGFSSDTEYLSRGAWTQSAAQYGVSGNFSYDAEAFYRWDPGQRVNNDFEEKQFTLVLKQQLTPKDGVYLDIESQRSESGDVLQYFDPAMANSGLRVSDRQEPLVILGYHREWSPGMHTLLLGTRIVDDLSIQNPDQIVPVASAFGGTSGQEISAVQEIQVAEQIHLIQETYSAELQQIFEQPEHTTIVGGRFQWGDFQSRNLQTNPSDLAGIFEDPTTPASQRFHTDLQRFNFYGYHQWQIAAPLLLVGGVSYDRLRFPENIVFGPLSTKEQTVDQVSPKAGLIWTPCSNSVIRMDYTRSLAGVSIEQSFRLEPSSVAGFNQAYRSIIPESVTGTIPGARIETYGLSLEQKFHTGTYLGLKGEILNSDTGRGVGSFRVDDTSDFAFPADLRQRLNFRERSLLFTADQLLGEWFSVGARYRASWTRLDENFVEIPNLPPSSFSPGFQPRQQLDTVLHQLNLHANFNHPSGVFAVAEAVWYLQSNSGFAPAEPGSEFWQVNLFAGYRFARRRAEISAGILNVADQNYRLNPLAFYYELPRHRTAAVRLQLNF